MKPMKTVVREYRARSCCLGIALVAACARGEVAVAPDLLANCVDAEYEESLVARISASCARLGIANLGLSADDAGQATNWSARAVEIAESIDSEISQSIMAGEVLWGFRRAGVTGMCHSVLADAARVLADEGVLDPSRWGQLWAAAFENGSTSDALRVSWVMAELVPGMAESDLSEFHRQFELSGTWLARAMARDLAASWETESWMGRSGMMGEADARDSRQLWFEIVRAGLQPGETAEATCQRALDRGVFPVQNGPEFATGEATFTQMRENLRIAGFWE